MTKKERHNKILEIIKENGISTQEELTAVLKANGILVTQATISRDLNELNLIKTVGANKKPVYTRAVFGDEKIPVKLINLFREIVVSIDCAKNLIVIKTLGGNAGAAGLAIDKMNFSQVLGTVAGDDTLLIVAKSNLDAEKIVKSLRTI